MPSIDIIIVEYKTGELIFKCLESLARYRPKVAELRRVVIVDNSSTKPSARFEKLPLPLFQINNDKNLGFAAACNKGARKSEADFMLFLNPDTRLTSGSIDSPITFLMNPSNRHVGIIGIQLLGQDGKIARTCSYRVQLRHFINRIFGLDRLSPRFFSNGMMDEWDHRSSRMVEGIMGAFYLVRRSVFEKLNGFDERFFMYYEETEFGLRAKQAGYGIYYLAEANAIHHGHGSTGRIKPERLTYSLQSRIRYGYKHFTWISATALLLATIYLEPLSRLTYACYKRSYEEIEVTIKGYIKFVLSLFETKNPE